MYPNKSETKAFFRAKSNCSLNNPVGPRDALALNLQPLLYFSADMSLRMIEWMELIKLQGISRVHVYDLAVHPNMKKVRIFFHFPKVQN